MPKQKMPTFDKVNFITVFNNEPPPGQWKIAQKAHYALRRYYLDERHPINTVVFSRDDEVFQNQHGGTPSEPILVYLLNSSKLPIFIPRENSLDIFADYEPFLVPVFTSLARAKNFFYTIESFGCSIWNLGSKDNKFQLLKYNHELRNAIKEKKVIINPPPEFVLTSILCMYVSDDGQACLNIHIYRED